MTADVEASIWRRAFDPDWSQLNPSAARAILQIGFNRADVDRMNQLAAIGRNGQLSDDQRAELEAYNRVGHVLAMLHSNARRALVI